MARKSSKRNGQEYQPPYQFWHEPDFWADECVSRGMTFMQRHFYRALLQAAFYCSTRPYLPTSDDELWKLADAGTKDNMPNVCVAQRNKTTAGRIVPSYLLTNYSGGLCGDCSQLLRFRNIGVPTPGKAYKMP